MLTTASIILSILTKQSVESSVELTDKIINQSIETNAHSGCYALLVTNALHSVISGFISSKSVLNGPLIVTDFFLGFANIYFMAKGIAAATSTTYFMPIIFGANIIRNINNILYRQYETKTTATIVENNKK